MKPAEFTSGGEGALRKSPEQELAWSLSRQGWFKDFRSPRARLLDAGVRTRAESPADRSAAQPVGPPFRARGDSLHQVPPSFTLEP